MTGEANVTTWRQWAACAGHPVHWWYPERPATTENINDAARAKQICGSCVVSIDCVTDAVQKREVYGIWGGLVPPRLGALRRQADLRIDWRIGRPNVTTTAATPLHTTQPPHHAAMQQCGTAA